jgi:hypothetical protein
MAFTTGEFKEYAHNFIHLCDGHYEIVIGWYVTVGLLRINIIFWISRFFKNGGGKRP